MTKVKIIGGIGNQLFQYFFARSLKLKFNINVELDLSDFEIYKLHQYNLNNFLKLKLPISKYRYSFIELFLKKKEKTIHLNLTKLFLKENFLIMMDIGKATNILIIFGIYLKMILNLIIGMQIVRF